MEYTINCDVNVVVIIQPPKTLWEAIKARIAGSASNAEEIRRVVKEGLDQSTERHVSALECAGERARGATLH